ncbi:hypothetical protein Hdeb2414_s0005g00162251 [Helianthus debilis subsp. tardiflorus]
MKKGFGDETSFKGGRLVTPQKQESGRDGLKHERLTGQEEARKRIRTRMHKVSDFRITS